jgi:hypothetical protein
MDKIELLSFQFGAGASDWHVTAGMLPCIRVDVDILQTNFAEIDHKQVRSLISELLKDLLAKASDLLARPVRVVENVCRGCFRSLWCRGGTSCRISPGSFSFSM